MIKRLLLFNQGIGEKIVINGKAFTSYSELKSEYPDFNLYVEEEMNKVLNDIETRRVTILELYSKLMQQHENDKREYFKARNAFIDRESEESKEELIKTSNIMAEIDEHTLEDLHNYISVLLDDRTKIRQFIEGLLQFPQGETPSGTGEPEGNPINSKFRSKLKVEFPKTTLSNAEQPSSPDEPGTTSRGGR